MKQRQSQPADDGPVHPSIHQPPKRPTTNPSSARRRPRGAGGGAPPSPAALCVDMRIMSRVSFVHRTPMRCLPNQQTNLPTGVRPMQQQQPHTCHRCLLPADPSIPPSDQRVVVMLLLLVMLLAAPAPLREVVQGAAQALVRGVGVGAGVEEAAAVPRWGDRGGRVCVDVFREVRECICLCESACMYMGLKSMYMGLKTAPSPSISRPYPQVTQHTSSSPRSGQPPRIQAGCAARRPCGPRRSPAPGGGGPPSV